jgi:AcrR family transcriptional regulator
MVKEGFMTARRALLNAARSLVAAKGVKAATVAAIAARAGVAKGLLFYYFKNKENVVKAVADELEAAYTASLRALPRAVSARESLHSLIAHHFAFLEKNPEGAQFMYQSAAASHGQGAGAFYAHLYAGILERLKRGAADGEFQVQDAEELAYMLLGSLHGIGRLKLFEFKRDYDAAARLAAFYDKLLPPPGAREPHGA